MKLIWVTLLMLNTLVLTPKLENKKLTSFIECVSNRVLQIDNIRSRFSNVGLEESDKNIIDNDDENFGRFAIY